MGPLPPTTDLAIRGRHPGLGSGATVWLFRHGEVHPDWQGRVYGGLDVPLSAAGEADTARVASAFASLRPARVVSSTLVRARRLGEALCAATGVRLDTDAGLVEVRRGSWQGLTVAELMASHGEQVERFYADPWAYDAHGGESDRDVLARAWPALERGLRAVSGGLLAVACHYNVLRVLVARAVGIAPEDSFRLRVDLAAACMLVDAPGGWVLERANVRRPEAGLARQGAGA